MPNLVKQGDLLLLKLKELFEELHNDSHIGYNRIYEIVVNSTDKLQELNNHLLENNEYLFTYIQDEIDSLEQSANNYFAIEAEQVLKFCHNINGDCKLLTTAEQKKQAYIRVVTILSDMKNELLEDISRNTEALESAIKLLNNNNIVAKLNDIVQLYKEQINIIKTLC
jgi:hypothetical protein